MLAVQSYHFFDFDKLTRCNNSKNTPTSTVKFAEISCPLLNKNNYDTILYTSAKHIDQFRHIKYKDIILIDEEYLDSFPNDFWSVIKLIAIKDINQPFIHCDMDLFLYKDISDNIKYSNFFAFHPEKWVNKSFFEIHSAFVHNFFPEINKSQFMSYNLGIFGGQNFEAINKASNDVLNFFTSNKNQLDLELKKHPEYSINSSWYKSVFLEQFLMVSLILKYNNMMSPNFIFAEETSDLTCRNMKNYNIIHLWTYIYRDINKYIGIDNFINMVKHTYLNDK
jgi:hypothetical protein